MLEEIKQKIENYYNSGNDIEFFTKNLEKGHTRNAKATSSIQSYLSGKSFQDIDVPLRFLIFANLDCTDCAIAVPVFKGLFDKMQNWKYSLVLGSQLGEDMENFFKVGPKKIYPQILVFNENFDYITRWVDKPQKAKEKLLEITKMNLDPDAKKQKIISTAELNPENMAVDIADELILLLKKYKYYLKN